MRFEWRKLVVRDPHLTDATRRVLLEFESYADPDGTNVRPGILTIATSLRTLSGTHQHVSERTVRSALADGIARGYIVLTAKAPRGRGNKLVDVYRLTLPGESQEPELTCKCAEELRARKERAAKILATQTAANTDEILATQTAANTAVNTGNSASKYRQSEAKYRQPRLPTTSSFTPDQVSPARKHAASVGNSTTDRERENRDDQPAGPPVPPNAWAVIREVIPAEQPQTVRTELALQVSTLQKSGTAPDVIRDSLTLWLKKPTLGPRALPLIVSEVLKRRNGATGNTKPGGADRAQSILDRTNRLTATTEAPHAQLD
ncbi:hypothetical protein [Rhodococcus sp. no. 34]